MIDQNKNIRKDLFPGCQCGCRRIIAEDCNPALEDPLGVLRELFAKHHGLDTPNDNLDTPNDNLDTPNDKLFDR